MPGSENKCEGSRRRAEVPIVQVVAGSEVYRLARPTPAMSENGAIRAWTGRTILPDSIVLTMRVHGGAPTEL